MEDIFDEDIDLDDLDFFDDKFCEPPPAKKPKTQKVPEITTTQKKHNELIEKNSSVSVHETNRCKVSAPHILKLPNERTSVPNGQLPKSRDAVTVNANNVNPCPVLLPESTNVCILEDDFNDDDWDLDFDVLDAYEREGTQSSCSVINHCISTSVNDDRMTMLRNLQTLSENVCHEPARTSTIKSQSEDSVNSDKLKLSGVNSSVTASSNVAVKKTNQSLTIEKSSVIWKVDRNVQNETRMSITPRQFGLLSSQQASFEEQFKIMWASLTEVFKLDRSCLASLQSYTVSWIARKAMLKLIPKCKIPFLVVRIKRITVPHCDASAVFGDTTGEIGGTIHSEVMDECCPIAGSFFVLQNITFVSPSVRRFHLLITLRNILCCINMEENELKLNKVFKGDLNDHLRHIANSLPKQQNDDEWKVLLQQMDDDEFLH